MLFGCRFLVAGNFKFLICLNCSQVSEWLGKEGFGEYSNVFEGNKIRFVRAGFRFGVLSSGLEIYLTLFIAAEVVFCSS